MHVPQDSLRSTWQSYYLNAHAVVLVIDSTDRGRLPQVKAEMIKLLVNVDLAKAVFLVLANKQDLADAMSAHEISEGLELHAIKSHEWHIQGACALTGLSRGCRVCTDVLFVARRLPMLTIPSPAGEGLDEGLDWIAARIA